MIERLLEYIISGVTDRGGAIAKVKLVKVLYLADVEHYRRWGETITELNWVFYKYGPYVMDIEPVLKRINLPEEEVETTEGYLATTWRPSGDFEVNIEKYLRPSQKRSVDRVIEKWGLEDTNAILDYVYFDTEPMEDARRGERLDFTKIQRHDAMASVGVPKLNASAAARFQERLKDLRETRVPRPRVSLKPAAMSEAERAASELAGEEEKYYLPRGQVAIDPETRDRWSKRAE